MPFPVLVRDVAGRDKQDIAIDRTVRAGGGARNGPRAGDRGASSDAVEDMVEQVTCEHAGIAALRDALGAIGLGGGGGGR